MGIITDKEMGSKPNGADQWFTDPAPRGAGRFLGRITSVGERSFYFRYTTSSGQRDTLAVGAYDPKGREIIASLLEAIDAEESGLPLASKFAVRTIDTRSPRQVRRSLIRRAM